MTATETIDHAPVTIDGIDELRAHLGQHLGYSDWLEITQDRVNRFADATGDHQWIHVDPERAATESPFGGPIAHGYLTLSIGPMLAPQVIQTTGFKMGVNYGSGKVRYPAPVPVGSRVRLGIEILEVEEKAPGQVMATQRYTFEIEGSAKPACVAEVLVLLYT